MRTVDRKAAVAAYKERRAIPGIYALRCEASGEIWVGQTPDLTTASNRIWFTLRQGSSPHRDLQSAWNRHGADQFAFDELERFDDPELGLVPDAVIRKRLAHWRARLDAAAI